MVNFMRSFSGRLLRFVLGVVLIWWGFAGDGGWIVGAIGFIPLIASIVNICLFAPLFGYTFNGRPKVRHA